MNLNIYTEEMSKSVWDKAFFMDKIQGAKCIIDFGCANGAMIKYLAPLFPDTEFLGYDANLELIHMACAQTTYNNVSFWHTTQRDKMIDYVKSHYQPNEICLNFSSVLHEVFSFNNGIEDIIAIVQQLAPKYITIRDMYWHAGPGVNYLRCQEKHIRESVLPQYLKEYESHFDYIHSPKHITHFLMKYQWKDNGWEDELKENYYSWDINDLLKLVDDIEYDKEHGDRTCYDLVFSNYYQLPYLTEKWLNEYGIYNVNAHTHAQFILRRM